MADIGDAFRFFGVALGLIKDAASLGGEHVRRYFAILWRAFIIFIFAAAIPIPVLAICMAVGLQANWLFSGYVVLLGLGACLLYLMTLPVRFAGEAVFRTFPWFQKEIEVHVERLSDILFGAIIIAIYAWVAPVWRNPSAIPFVVLVILAVVFGAAARRIFRLDSKHGVMRLFRTIQLAFLAVFSVASIFIPQTVRALANTRGQIDGLLAETMKPQAVEVADPDVIRFTSEIDGTPRLWYHLSAEGEYELYDRPGHHRTGAALTPAGTDDERRKITKYFRLKNARAERERQAAEQARVEKEQREAERLAAEKRDRELQEQREREEQAEKAKQEFLDRYLADQSFVNRPGSQEIAVMAVDGNNALIRDLQQKFATALRSESVNVSDGFFSQAMISDGIFTRLFEGSRKDAAELELASHADLLLLCRTSVTYEDHPDLKDITTARLEAQVRVIQPSSGEVLAALALQEAGAGFSKEAAQEAAYERLAMALAKSNEMKALSGTGGG